MVWVVVARVIIGIGKGSLEIISRKGGRNVKENACGEIAKGPPRKERDAIGTWRRVVACVNRLFNVFVTNLPLCLACGESGVI